MAPIEVVISGIGGAFPQSEGLEDFVDNLLAGKNLSSVDDLRWKPGLLGTSPHVGKISNVHRFDNNLFRVHTTLARLMDPLARLMLERSMEAILDAGLSPKDLDNTYTSVYMTTTVSESESRTTSLLHAKKHAGYAIMAGSKTMMSNRISYCLNLNGPSVTIDGDWTVANVALQRAARSIEIGESDFALIGAANTCLFPEVNRLYENHGFISKDGQSRTLDKNASGCFRSEGSVVFLLQRADKARRIYARVSGISEICRGTRSVFLGVDALALSPLMEELYRSKGIDVNKIKMLTSDGMSIADVEKDEVEASAAVLCKKRSGLPISNAKATAGHGDAVGALVSIIHAIAAMERGVIPPLKHAIQPHPDAKALLDGRLEVVKEQRPIQITEDSVMAVNTLGFSGCIAHSVFKPNPKDKQIPSEESQQYPRLVVISGRTEEDAVAVANKIIDRPFDPEFIRLTQAAFSKPINGYTSRAAAIIPSLDKYRPTVTCLNIDKKDRPVWFVYSGMGSQWAGMGKGLLRLPIFAETIKRLQPILEPEGIDLTETITTDNADLFENIIYSFISIAAIQIGLTNVMKSLGVEPDGIIGHSTGELGCAYADGCLTEEQTLRAAYARGKASLACKLITGKMASIGMAWTDAEASIPKTMDVACHNSGDNCTISGPAEEVEEFVEQLKKKNIFARAVNVSNIAFHSRYVQPAGAHLQKYLNEVIKNPKRRTPRWVPTSLNPGDVNKPELEYASPAFFTNNLLSCVRFEEAMAHVPANSVVIELAPHGLMQPLIRRGLPEEATTVALTKRGHPDGFRFLLENIGKLYIECVPLKPWVLAPNVDFPVSRGTPCLNSLATWDHREEWPLVINTRSQVSRPVSFPLYPETTPCIMQNGERCAAPSNFMEVVWTAVADGKLLTSCPVVFTDLKFTNAVKMEAKLNLELELQLQRETGQFEIGLASQDGNWDEAVCVMKGRVEIPDPTELVGMASHHPTDNSGIVLEAEDVYAEMEDRNLRYDQDLQILQRVSICKTETTGQCNWGGKWNRLIDGLFQLAALSESESSIFCAKIRKLTIAPQEIRALSNALPVRRNNLTGDLAAPGVTIEGYQRLPTIAKSSVSAMDLAVRPLEQRTTKDTEDFIQTVAALRVQNSDTTQDFSILVLEKERNDLAIMLEKALGNLVGSQVPVNSRLVQPGMKFDASLKAVVIVTDFRSNQADRVIDELQSGGCTTIMVLRWGMRGGHDLATIASNTNSECSLSLLVKRKPLTEDEVHVVPVKAEVPADVDVPGTADVILVWRGLPLEGVCGAVAGVRGRPYGARARIVIIKDDDAPEFCLQKETYRERLELGLLVNILEHGRWSELLISTFDDLPVVPSRIDGVDTSFYGLNPTDLQEEGMSELGAFDYCGKRDNTRVIGLARLLRQATKGTHSGVATPDEILRWDVPAFWSDHEAATVPMAYAVAYHVLTVLTNPQPGQTVLVMNGLSPVGQACIRVASHKGCHVITTASNERLRKEIITANPQVPPERVLRDDKNTLKYLILKLTGSLGPDVLIMPASRVAADVWSSCPLNGQGIVMCRKNAAAHRVGMGPFMNSTGLSAGGGSTLLSTTSRDKKLVQAAVQGGIAAGVVRPLNAHILDRVDGVDIASLQTSVKQLLRANETPNGRGAGMSMAVLGGSVNTLLTLAHTASAKGSIVSLAALSAGASATTTSRAKLRPELRNTNIMTLPKDHSGAKQFLNVACKADNLKAIITNCEDSSDRSMMVLLNGVLPTVNGALRDVRLLVVTECFSLGTEMVEAWRRSGRPACTIVGNPHQAAYVLPSLLTVAELPATVVAYPQGADCRVALGAPTFRPVRYEEGELPRAAARTFIEISSLAPRMRTRHHRMEPLPLFVVAGPVLTPAIVRTTATSLMSPVLVTDGCQQTAENLAQEVLRQHPRGPWAMLGDAECAPLLLRAVRIVEKKAGNPRQRAVVHLAIYEFGGKDTKFDPKELQNLEGSLHFIRQIDGQTLKETVLNKNKMRHFVAGPSHIATVLNNHVLSPLPVIVSA